MYEVHQIEDQNRSVLERSLDVLWDKADKIVDFISPWDSEKIEKIEFQALWDTKNFYFLFKVYDQNIHIDRKDNSIESIGNSDRVELFFRTNKEMNPYFCLEMDPSNRVMDFKAYPGKKFDFDWTWPKDNLTLKSAINKEFFTVEGQISLSSLKELGVIKDDKMEVGVFRAKFNKSEFEDYKPTWISWIKPNSETPNFHIPSAFGVFQLKND
ncbi:sugar-binding protein [Cellulophaga sp. Z1A5H]|uniref:sugar-binding protein n=1 Tax=Cellulophaga sp. Z1A5H TaxID=2687291 RepID=UPI0013FD4577|nr:sugar-binding protein [Cellulophaga sp. Z1A5H]